MKRGTLGEQSVASLAPWVSLRVKQPKPLPGSPCSIPTPQFSREAESQGQRDRGALSNEETSQMLAWPFPEGTQVTLSPRGPSLVTHDQKPFLYHHRPSAIHYGISDRPTQSPWAPRDPKGTCLWSHRILLSRQVRPNRTFTFTYTPDVIIFPTRESLPVRLLKSWGVNRCPFHSCEWPWLDWPQPYRFWPSGPVPHQPSLLVSGGNGGEVLAWMGQRRRLPIFRQVAHSTLGSLIPVPPRCSPKLVATMSQHGWVSCSGNQICYGTRLEHWWKNQVALRDLGGLEIYLTQAGSEETVCLQRSQPWLRAGRVIFSYQPPYLCVCVWGGGLNVQQTREEEPGGRGL